MGRICCRISLAGRLSVEPSALLTALCGCSAAAPSRSGRRRIPSSLLPKRARQTATMDAASPASPSASSPPPPSPTAGASAVSPMTTISRHFFGGDSSEDDHDFYIDIIENMQEDYGMFVWPCSIVLAEYVWQQRLRFANNTVIELGAGTSLPGLVAAKVGANVILTDNAEGVEVLKNMRQICNLNKVNCNILGLTWGQWDAPIFDLHPQIVLGADVFYDTTDFDNLFATVTFLLQNSPGSVFITTYHNRSGHHLIEFLMAKWGLTCSKLLDGFSIMPPCKAASLQGNIQLVEITLDNQKSKS